MTVLQRFEKRKRKQLLKALEAMKEGEFSDEGFHRNVIP